MARRQRVNSRLPSNRVPCNPLSYLSFFMDLSFFLYLLKDTRKSYNFSFIPGIIRKRSSRFCRRNIPSSMAPIIFDPLPIPIRTHIEILGIDRNVVDLVVKKENSIARIWVSIDPYKFSELNIAIFIGIGRFYLSPN